MSETPVQFDSDGATLRGVLHAPDAPPRAAVAMLHGWSGCRLGPHRMFVTAARRLCAAGIACLRFDFSGRGESDGDRAGASIARMVADARRALDFLQAHAAGAPLLLLGICSGGKVAVSAAADDPRVGGLVLWSAEPMGPLRSGAVDRRKSLFSLRAYARKLLRPETWRKLFSGRVNVGLVRKAVVDHERPDAAEIRAETAALARFRRYRGPAIFIYGGSDPDTRLAAQGYRAFCAEAGIRAEFHEIEGANHSFYSLDWERRVLDLTGAWLNSFASHTP